MRHRMYFKGGIMKEGLKHLFHHSEPEDITMDQFNERRKIFKDNDRFSPRRTNFHPTMYQRILYYDEPVNLHNRKGGYYSTH